MVATDSDSPLSPLALERSNWFEQVSVNDQQTTLDYATGTTDGEFGQFLRS